MDRAHSEAFEVFNGIKSKRIGRQKHVVKLDYEIDKIVKTKTTTQSKCPFCNIIFEKNKLNLHLILEHICSDEPISSKISEAQLHFIDNSGYPRDRTSPIAGYKELVLCKACRSVVAKKNFIKHIVRVHKDINKLPSLAKKQLSDFLVRTKYEIKCPTCNSYVPTIEFAGHMYSCGLVIYKSSQAGNPHKKHKLKKKKTNHSFVDLGKPADNSRYQSPSESKKMDATYGHHVIRDIGKFGSHPSYDRFDDESNS